MHCILYCIAFYIALHCIALHLKARQFDGGVVRRLERRIPIGDPEAWKPLITQSNYRFNTILATTALPMTILTTMYCIDDYCISDYWMGDYSQQ